LLIIVSAHSLASLTFLTSDELLDLKLQKKRVFQQTVSRITGQVSSSTHLSERREILLG